MTATLTAPATETAQIMGRTRSPAGCILARVLLLLALQHSSAEAVPPRNGGGEPTDVTLDVDWPAFLSRHDLAWDWLWGSTAASTLSPRNLALHRCGAGGTPGQCCLEASAPAPVPAAAEEYWPGYIQLALSDQKPRGCSPTASPPKLCCLPVPGSQISGCHPTDESRWHYNQFFRIQPASADAGSSSTSGDNSTFRLLDKQDSKCYTAASTAATPTLATCASPVTSSSAASVAASHQHWRVLTPAVGSFLLQNVGSR